MAQRDWGLAVGRRGRHTLGMCYDTQALSALIAFRRETYESVLGHRKDTLCELMDAALTGPGPANLVHLSLAPAFRRRWPSACDALADGDLKAEAAQKLVSGMLPTLTDGAAPLWVVDGTTWPRPAASTSPERTYGRRVTAGFPQDGVVPAWEYEWLVAVPEAEGSWVLPLDVCRRGPSAGTPTQVAIRQLQTALDRRAADAPRPVVVLDSGYDPVQLGRAQLRANLLVRLKSNRVFCRVPGPYQGRGAPRKHGAPFRLKAPASHGAPDRSAEVEDAHYGQVRIEVWQQLHARSAAAVPFSLVRVQVGRLPRREQPPAPLWLAWIGGELPDDLTLLWRWYLRRFTVEHGFRFLKQALGWTTIQPRHPEAGDRWGWLLALVLWQLWLARGLVADRRLPWEAHLPPEHLSPGRVRRAFPGLLGRLGTPAREPKPRGKPPGRRLGEKPGPRKRCPVTRRHVGTAA